MNNGDSVLTNNLEVPTGGFGADWLAAREAELKLLKAERDKRCSPIGALNLPSLVDERRWKWKIPDEAFVDQASFERVFLWQIPDGEPDSETVGDGQIILSTQGKKRVQNEAPRGILISAGLGAMDHLYAHGMAVGHIVKFVRLAPWRIPMGTIMGEPVHVLVMDVANLVSSEDTRRLIRDGKLTIEFKDGQHRFWGEDGPRPITHPLTPEDYR